MKRTLSLLALAGIVMSQSLWSQSPGDLDPSFSTNGWLVENGGTDAEYSAVATLPDGRIVAAGIYDAFNDRGIWVCRWLPDGTLDTGFDGDGRAVLSGYMVENDRIDMELQSDGKVVVATYVTDMNGDYGLLARFDMAGALDSTFGQGGIVLEPSSGVAEGFDRIHILSNGRILATSSGTGALSVTAFTHTGARDNGYGPFSGQVVLPFAGFDDVSLKGSDLMASGSLTLLAEVTSGGSRSLQMLRLDDDGDLVQGFGTAGIVSAVDTFWSDPGAFAVADNGEVYVAGMPPTWTGNLPVLVRKYTASGALDGTWGQSGAALAQSSGHLHCWTMMVASNGNVYIGGDYDAGPTDIMLARFNTSGQLDGSFGNGGVATDLTTGGMIWAQDLAEQSDGKIVAAGVQNNVSNVSGFVARFLTSPATATESVAYLKPEVSVHPNPASDQAVLRVNLQKASQLDLAIVDMAGRVCLPIASQERHDIGLREFALPTAELPAGIYQVLIHADGHTLAQRLVVAH